MVAVIPAGCAKGDDSLARIFCLRRAWGFTLTGDGKNDLIVLVHDRILVYPQE
jgi:hypothetical protein